ncbi:purine and uridine phosphorylase [Neurospora hispaniola]|uniref:Purine and uridine phosphorylase n=1 Tax=Neurospora hispaniola TaxID=588809 RepID=A0AAJ0HZH0_9PEZI|nr:purine and uridine phosphorylase [Neurospora hispaniola]
MATEQTDNPRSHSDYTIGWVCALAHEGAAATAMLDVEHGPLTQRPNDTNSYTLGSIAKHNIVITCLPMGEIGTTAATTVVERMLSTFPSIRFGLMVGVGGGIPPKVRLGDVVVSVPSSHYPGVVQWDMGKTIQGSREGDESFERTGSLNRPPHILLTAVNNLKAQHERRPSRIPEFLKQLESNSPMMASRYLRSEALKDEDDGDCRFCDSAQIIKRKPPARTMRIHYGLIVSGNQVIKNALSRDKLNAKFGGRVLCIEMEAAGLMNNFPCLVIRGTCDYADSHKNKRWQRHAAAVAAAYAKELLHVVRPVDVNGERAAFDIIKEVKQKVVETAENVNYLKRGLQRREDLDVLDWLTPMNFGSQHSLYRDKQQRGTGAGKTILSSIVIEDLTNISHSLAGETEAAYIYCDYRRQGEQTALELLSSLTKQLCLSKEYLSPGVGALHAKYTSKSTRPSLQEVTRALKDVIKHFTRVYVVVDALDELIDDEDHRNAFVDGLRNLVQSSSNLKLFITSRPLLTDINQFFDDAAKVEISANQDDLGRYVDGRFSKMPVSSPLRANEVLQQEVKDTISQAARGMFLLAQLYMDSLRDKSTPKEVRDVLQGMQHQDNAPKKLSVEERLYKAYGETMARIDKQERGFRDRAMQILLWVTHAKRPLSTEELRHALAVEVGRTELDEDNLVVSLDVSICAGLAIVDDKTQEVRLVHYTTQEYLERRHFKPPLYANPHVAITDICVTYLMFSIFRSGPCTFKDQYIERISRNSLYLYAAKYWAKHAHFCSEASELLLGFLQCKEAMKAAAQASEVGLAKYGWLFEDWEEYESDKWTTQSAFHWAVMHGLHRAAEALPERSEDLNALYKQKTPLYMALEDGDMTMARILLCKGAQVRVLGGTPVLEAICEATYGEFEVDVSMVEDLLKKGAEIANSKGDCPLLVIAASRGHEQLVDFLVQRGANPESLGEISWWDSDKVTPLFAAAHKSHMGTAMILWKTGADPNRTLGKNKSSALHEAVKIGHEQLVEMFLGTENGVDLNISGDSPVDIARVESLDYGLKAESHDLAKECISISARIAVDIESQDSNGHTPLALAAISGHCRIAGILNGRDQTPLEVALNAADQSMVETLCRYCAYVEETDSYGRKYLEHAISKGAVGCVKVLLRPCLSWLIKEAPKIIEKCSLWVHEATDESLIDNEASYQGRHHQSEGSMSSQLQAI